LRKTFLNASARSDPEDGAEFFAEDEAGADDGDGEGSGDHAFDVAQYFWTEWTDLGIIPVMIAHQLQTAKQCFSAVAARAAKGNPQLVTKHGKPFVIIVSADDWRRSHEPERGIWDVLRSCPADLSELSIARDKGLPRKVVL